MFWYCFTKNKNNIEALEGKAFILLEQKYYEEALNLYEEAIKLNPSNENNLLGKVKCLENIGKTEEVLNIINEIKGIDKIKLLIKYDKIEEAEKEINKLLEKDENDINAIFLKGYILYVKNNLDDAKEIFDKIIEKDKNNYLALYNCGLILLNNNRTEEAENYFKKCFEIEHEFSKALICLGNV